MSTGVVSVEEGGRGKEWVTLVKMVGVGKGVLRRVIDDAQVGRELLRVVG